MRTLRQEIIQREQAQQELYERYHYLETVHAISQSILEASDITHILDELLEKTMTVGGFDLGNIRLFDTSGRIVDAAIEIPKKRVSVIIEEPKTQKTHWLCERLSIWEAF